MKEYLTCNDSDFKDLCQKIVIAMKMSTQQISGIKDGCVIIATDNNSESWRNVRKQLMLIRFNRSSSVLEDTVVRECLDKAKASNCIKAVLVSSSGYTGSAKKFAENRPIELFDKGKLEKLLSAAGL